MKKLTGIVMSLAFVLCAVSVQAVPLDENCNNNADCNDDVVYCNGVPSCSSETSKCVAGTPVSCESDGLFCNGPEVCSEDIEGCVSQGNPCSYSCLEETDQCVECITDDNCTDNNTPFCVENTCVACRVETDEDCDNGLFCDGAETCDNGTCFDGEPPCGDNQTMPSALSFCNEETDQCVECFEDFDCSDNGTPRCDGVMCVECLDDFDCDNGTFCREGVCAVQACDLIIKPRQVRINKMFRPVERRFRITGGEGFDPYAKLDFGLIRVRRAAVSRKGVLKVLTTIPAGAIPNKGPYEIRVGDCVGEIILR
ncbi:MAG: hypothetical protein FJ119_07180 [Deltaproteobacteria bacterium]|nr:hypothetical protein [Deltaproteobacteria bacterium]